MDRPQMVMRDRILFPDTSFPFTASTTEGVHPGFQRLHWHQTLEINYIRSGSGYYLINGMKIPFEEGDLLFINSNDLHRAFETKSLQMDIMMFEPSLLAIDLKYDPDLMRPFREAGVYLSHVIKHDEPITSELVPLFHRMMEENRNREAAFMSLVRADLIRFLGLTNRYLHKTPQQAVQLQVKQRGMHALRKVLHTMELNLSYGWTLNELADLAHLSPSRFSALFHQTVGTSPLNYLIQLRLTQAMHLLETTDMKITGIAEECGFRNLSNFNRLFKLHIGLSPSELRGQS
ncbi:AraC family transcriptional regulator [Paenibacillus dakarensis]|uniref:AraC family transcriptional regulator n=1 Tax=Paenibacillus dakarensis TaxID=1527293 RepID=UPI0006D55C71|nr:AraC family transcriptional regulator [Paenibacillus dakarensis]